MDGDLGRARGWGGRGRAIGPQDPRPPGHSPPPMFAHEYSSSRVNAQRFNLVDASNRSNQSPASGLQRSDLWQSLSQAQREEVMARARAEITRRPETRQFTGPALETSDDSSSSTPRPRRTITKALARKRGDIGTETGKSVHYRSPSPSSSESEKRTEIVIECIQPEQETQTTGQRGISDGGGQDQAAPGPVVSGSNVRPDGASSKISTHSAPSRPQKQVRKQAIEKDRQSRQLTSGRSEFIPPGIPRSADLEAIQQEPAITVPPKQFFYGYASINKIQVDGLPVYTVDKIESDRLVLRSLGKPHREVIVFKKGSTFNGISLTEFAVEEVLDEGDNVVVEDICAYYDKSSDSYVWRALHISFPRDVTKPMEKGSRWITQGRIVKFDNRQVFVNTELRSPEGLMGESILIKATHITFGCNNLRGDEKVIVRALLSGYGPNCWSLAATSVDTPWSAENIAVAGQFKSGYGFLRRNHFPTYWAIAASNLGFVYIPSELMTPDLKGAGDESRVYFEASLFVAPNDPEWSKVFARHRYVATCVRLSKEQEQDVRVQECGRIYDPARGNLSSDDTPPETASQSEVSTIVHVPYRYCISEKESSPTLLEPFNTTYPGPIAATNVVSNIETGQDLLDLTSPYICAKCKNCLACTCPL